MSTLSQFLLRDADGQVYLNYLKTLNSDVMKIATSRRCFSTE